MEWMQIVEDRDSVKTKAVVAEDSKQSLYLVDQFQLEILTKIQHVQEQMIAAIAVCRLITVEGCSKKGICRENLDVLLWLLYQPVVMKN